MQLWENWNQVARQLTVRLCWGHGWVGWDWIVWIGWISTSWRAVTGSAIESISLGVRVASSNSSSSSSRNVCVCANVCLGINGNEARWFVYYFLWSVFVWHAITFWQPTTMTTTTTWTTSRRVHIESSGQTTATTTAATIGINNGSQRTPPMSGYRAAPGHLKTLTSGHGPKPALDLPHNGHFVTPPMVAAGFCAEGGSRLPPVDIDTWPSCKFDSCFHCYIFSMPPNGFFSIGFLFARALGFAHAQAHWLTDPSGHQLPSQRPLGISITTEPKLCLFSILVLITSELAKVKRFFCLLSN